MSINSDVVVFAKKVYELSTLTLAEIEARKWEALLIVNAVYSAATPAGIAKSHADRDARWGDVIRSEGFLAALHPKWHLRTDDGKPPAIKHALESAIDNPNRDLRTRLQTLQFIPPNEREALTDLVRAFIADAFRGAKGFAREEYFNVMRARSATWFRDPWLVVLPFEGQAPGVSILVDNQGPTHDGSMWDDPDDDTAWEKTKFSWAEAIRTWDGEVLRDNPLAQLYLKTEATVAGVVDTASDTAKGLAFVAKWAPYTLGGIAIIGLTTFAVSLGRR